MNSPLPNLLIIGATGFIGKALMAFFIREGFSVTCLLISSRQQKSHVALIEGLKLLETPTGDLNDLTETLAKTSFDVIINLAAGGVRPGERTAKNLVEGNIEFLLDTLSAVSENPPRLFIQTGSWFEYQQTTEQKPINEQTALLTRSLYGSAKAASFLMGVASAYALSIPFITLRLFQVYGPGEPSHRLIPTLQKALTNNEPIALSSGTQIRDFLFLSDILEAFKAAILTPNMTKHSAYNICTGWPITVREMCETIADQLDAPEDLLRFGAIPDRSDEAEWAVGDNDLFCQMTNWHPKVKLSEGINKIVNAKKQ